MMKKYFEGVIPIPSETPEEDTVLENKAREVLTEHRKSLDLLAKALLEYETLTGDEVDSLLKGKDVVRKKSDTTDSPSSSIPPVEAKGTSEKKAGEGKIKSPEPQHGTSS